MTPDALVVRLAILNVSHADQMRVVVEHITDEEWVDVCASFGHDAGEALDHLRRFHAGLRGEVLDPVAVAWVSAALARWSLRARAEEEERHRAEVREAMMSLFAPPTPMRPHLYRVR